MWPVGIVVGGPLERIWRQKQRGTDEKWGKMMILRALSPLLHSLARGLEEQGSTIWSKFYLVK